MSALKVPDTTSFLGSRRDSSGGPHGPEGVDFDASVVESSCIRGSCVRGSCVRGSGPRRKLGWATALIVVGASLASNMACGDRRIKFCSPASMGVAGGCPAAGGSAGTGGQAGSGGSSGAGVAGTGGAGEIPVGGSGGESAGTGGTSGTGGGGAPDLDASVPEDGGLVDGGDLDASVTP